MDLQQKIELLERAMEMEDEAEDKAIRSASAQLLLLHFGMQTNEDWIRAFKLGFSAAIVALTEQDLLK